MATVALGASGAPMERSKGPVADRYVRHLLEACGATVRSVDGNVWEALLPHGLVEELGIASPFRFTFDAAYAAPGVEVLSYGSATLDGMLQLGKRRGEACSFMFADAEVRSFLAQACEVNPWNPTDTRIESSVPGTLRRIRFPNVRQRLVGRRILHQNQLLFHFKVAYISDEKREEMLTLWVDPVTEEVDEPADLDRAVAVNLNRAPQAGQKLKRGSEPHAQGIATPVPLADTLSWGEQRFGPDAYALLRLYRKACEHLEVAIGPALARFQEDVASGLQRELTRIDEYYREMAAESVDPLRKLFRRMATANVRAQLARSTEAQRRYQQQLREMKREAGVLESTYTGELHSLEEERARRETELREKHRVRVEVELTNVASVRVPRVEWTLRLSGPARREIAFLYDVLRDRVLELDCESCGEPMVESVYLCSCGDAVCSRCAQPCSGCRLDICPSCTTRRCHLCDDLICDECESACPAGEEWPTFEPSHHVCANCRTDSCPSCQAALRLGTEW